MHIGIKHNAADGNLHWFTAAIAAANFSSPRRRICIVSPSPVTTGGRGWGLGVMISNLGGGSPVAKIAVYLAEPSAEMSVILPNISPIIDNIANSFAK